MQRSEYGLNRRKMLAGLGVGLAGLAGCTGDDGDDNGGGGDSISVTGVWTESEEEDFRAVMDHVMDETDLDIEYHPRTTEALLTGTLMDYESGVAPADVVVMPSPARVEDDGEAGHLESVGDTWNPDDFAAGPEPVTVDGDVYAAPFKMDLKPGFWYRQSFFDEHDLSEPESYDEFVSLLDEISGIDGVDAPLASGNGVGWPLSDVTEAFILRQDDGAQLQEDLISGDASFTDDRIHTAFEELQQLHQDGYWSELRDFGVQYEYFWDNQLPLYFQGSFTTSFEAIQDPSDLGVFRLPGVDGMVATVNWFTVPTYSQNVEGAKEALGEFVSADGQQVWAERGGFIPSNEGVSSDAFDIDVMSNLIELAGDVRLVQDLDDALGNPFQEEFWSQLLGFWAEPDTDIDGMLSDLDSALQDTHEG